MSAARVSERAATAVLEAVRGMFPADLEFTLYPAEHEGLPRGSWSIAAEGWYGEQEWPRTVAESASYERNLLADMGGVSICPPTFPRGVFLEPMTSWSLGIYPMRGI
jgi:hypothetical protein